MQTAYRGVIKFVIGCCFIAICCKEVFAFSLPEVEQRVNFKVVKRNATSNERRESRVNNCECGIENDNSIYRVRGGGVVDPPNRYPWMVSLLKTTDDTYFFCGGAVINRQYILTAAHCLKGKEQIKVSVALGVHDLQSAADEIIDAKDLMIHPYYDQDFMIYDIALIKLERPVTFTDNIRPVCLPDRLGMGLVNHNVIAAGWGRTYAGGTVTRFLRSTEVSVVSESECANKWYDHIIDKKHVCAGGYTGRSSCKGDSGGPLIYEKNNRYHTIGIVSYGEYGCPQYRPAIYTRVSFFIDWINAKIADAPACY